MHLSVLCCWGLGIYFIHSLKCKGRKCCFKLLPLISPLNLLLLFHCLLPFPLLWACRERERERVGNEGVMYGAEVCLLSWITVRLSLFWPLSGHQLVKELQSCLQSKSRKPELWHCCHFLAFALCDACDVRRFISRKRMACCGKVHLIKQMFHKTHINVSVAHTVKHGAGNSKVMGSISWERMNR